MTHCMHKDGFVSMQPPEQKVLTRLDGTQVTCLKEYCPDCGISRLRPL